jgi:hypothetical protein
MKSCITIFVGLLLISNAQANADIKIPGTMKVNAGPEHPARLRIACLPESDSGSLVIELTIPDAYTRKDFDYDDFEGPDAPTDPLSRVDYVTAAHSAPITMKASGSYIPQPANAFQFAINEPPRRKSQEATLIASFGSQPGKFVWTQSSIDQSQRRFTATFDFDVAEATRVHDMTIACLPKKK